MLASQKRSMTEQEKANDTLRSAMLERERAPETPAAKGISKSKGKPPKYESPFKKQKLMPDLGEVNEAWDEGSNELRTTYSSAGWEVLSRK